MKHRVDGLPHYTPKYAIHVISCKLPITFWTSCHAGDTFILNKPRLMLFIIILNHQFQYKQHDREHALEKKFGVTYASIYIKLSSAMTPPRTEDPCGVTEDTREANRDYSTAWDVIGCT